MTANQRRSGFRLPWVGDEDDPSGSPAPAASESADASAQPAPADASAQPAPAVATNGTAVPAVEPSVAEPDPSVAPSPAAPVAAPAATAAATPSPEAPSDFLRDLIGAMRNVADEARSSGVTKLKAEAEEAIRALEADAERRKQELRERADTDVTGVGAWAAAEAERIKAEAEQRVAARRAQLEQQLAAEGTRTEAEMKALRARVADYERELEAFHAQLNEINDPAAFAAAAKRMPRPPELTPRGAPAAAARAAAPSETTPANAAAETTNGQEAVTPGASHAVPEPGGTPEPPAPAEPVHPAEEEVLSARLADLDAKLGDEPAPAASGTPAETATAAEGSATTDIVVKGLGSFGAITGFRQALSGQPGITGVALSLGQSGEFVFRATHAPGFDVGAAISEMEGDNATVEPRPEGGLRVSLERPR